MNTVIKGTKSIAEYKETKRAMEKLATTYFEKHYNSCESWTHGDIKKVWKSYGCEICIEYMDGMWWFYGDERWWQ